MNATATGFCRLIAWTHTSIMSRLVHGKHVYALSPISPEHVSNGFACPAIIFLSFTLKNVNTIDAAHCNVNLIIKIPVKCGIYPYPLIPVIQ